MRHSTKLVLNTGSLYVKIIVACLVQLIATRIALHALGEDSFGLYNLIAGVILMLSFFNGALIISAQRFMSVAIGAKDDVRLASIFNVSILIHLIFAGAICVLLFALQPLLFNGFLKYPAELQGTAVRVYDLMIISSAVTVLTIPYSASINAREDMWFFAISEVVSALLKLWAAYSLVVLKGDLLMIYTMFMVLAIVVGALLKVVWCRVKYKEARIHIGLMKNKPLFKEMFGFVGWNTLGSAAVVVRNQGVAVLLNTFFSTAINAAYGVANQVNSLVLSFASTITTVFAPSIIQQKGTGNFDKMRELAVFSSKLSFLLSSMMALPLLLFTNELLDLWLVEIPNATNELVFWIIVTFLILQLYPGINRMIYAMGDIKAYQIAISICLIAILPIGFVLLKLGCPPVTIVQVMATLQFATLVVTIQIAKKKCGLNVSDFWLRSVVVPVLLLTCVFVAFWLVCRFLIIDRPIWLVLLLSLIIAGGYAIVYLPIVLNKNEKSYLKQLLPSKFRKVNL